jgi:hypothetical protein
MRSVKHNAAKRKGGMNRASNLKKAFDLLNPVEKTRKKEIKRGAGKQQIANAHLPIVIIASRS